MGISMLIDEMIRTGEKRPKEGQLTPTPMIRVQIEKV